MVVGPLLHAFWILEGSIKFVPIFFLCPLKRSDIQDELVVEAFQDPTRGAEEGSSEFKKSLTLIIHI